MFLLGLGSKRIQDIQNDDLKPEESVIRSCSRCGCFFEVVYDSENNSNTCETESTFDTVESAHEMFLDYLSLEERNPDNFEDFVLQFIEVSIEKDNANLENKTNVEESLCVDCMNCLISQFSMALNKEIGIMDKYTHISDLILPSEIENDILTKGSEQENTSLDENKEVMDIYFEFLKMKQINSQNNFEIKENEDEKNEINILNNEGKEEKTECGFEIINTIEMEELVELKENQNYELNLKHELVQYESKNKGMKNHLTFLSGYLERLKRSDFLNLSFYIQVNDGITSINGLRPILFDSDFENWNEVNAALGTSALLLYVILERHNLPLNINPSGSYSTIKDSSSSIWPLHGNTLCNSDYNECTNFDMGVSLFVNLIDTVYNTIPGPEKNLPYIVDQKKATIGGICPKLLFNERESWNRAMSMNLINLKWLLVRSSESIKK